MELLERFAQGDMDAFEALFRDFQRDVYGWIVRIVRDPSAAEDLTVDAFWRVYRAHARFDPRRKAQSGKPQNASTWNTHAETDPEGSFGAWLRRIATNAAFDHLKRMRRELPLTIDPAEEVRMHPSAQRELREQIGAAFGQLSPKLRVVATLALVEDVPYDEIAGALGISVVTVRVRVFRAVQILRERLASLLAHSQPATTERVTGGTAQGKRSEAKHERAART